MDSHAPENNTAPWNIILSIAKYYLLCFQFDLVDIKIQQFNKEM